jgi:hypothetical protein
VAAQQARRSQTLGAVWNAMRATGRSLGKILHQLWLEVIGAVFLAMAAMGGIAMVHEYAKFAAGRATISRVAIAACFTLAFGWFGMSSFWRVKRSNSKQRT